MNCCWTRITYLSVGLSHLAKQLNCIFSYANSIQWPSVRLSVQSFPSYQVKLIDLSKTHRADLILFLRESVCVFLPVF